MALTFRKATLEDVASLAKINRASALSKHLALATKFRFTEKKLSERIQSKIESLEEDGYGFMTVAEDEQGNIVGFVEGGHPRSKFKNKGIFKDYKGLIRRKHVKPGAQVETELDDALQEKGKEELAARGINTALLFVPKSTDLTEEQVESYNLEKVREVRIRRGVLKGARLTVYSIKGIE